MYEWQESQNDMQKPGCSKGVEGVKNVITKSVFKIFLNDDVAIILKRCRHFRIFDVIEQLQ